MAMNSIPSLKDAIYKIQTYLLDGISKENQLLAAANLISRSDYDDVVTERTITNLCGYPLCNKYLPCDRPKKGRYRISLKEHSVYDLKETWLYCSPECVINSQAFSKLLKPERCEFSDPGKIAEILNLFSSPSIEESNAGGAEKNEKISLAFSSLTIHEKEDVSVGDIQSMDFVGPYNAIEGYVPRQDQVPPVQRKGSKSGKSTTKKDPIYPETNFASTIIIGEPSSGNLQKNSSSKFVNDHVHVNVEGSKREQHAQEKSQSHPKETKLRSALKNLGAKASTRTVSWADEQQTIVEGIQNMTLNNCQGIESGSKCKESSDSLSVEDTMISSRRASAEACASALTEAAAAVASGQSNTLDAASEAGILIFPCPNSVEEENIQKVADELKPEEGEKWVKRPSLLHTGAFDTEEDSWYDAPPEGFSLTLSSFATMWMALFGWVTASSMAYIYGRAESAEEEFVVVDGREYPHKFVLGDGLSSEIKETLSGCLARALPGVVANIKLPTPISTLEVALGRLLDTMTFTEALPPFRMKQWHVIVLLFLDALSVHIVPALEQHIASRRTLVHKMLEDAQVSNEEYNIMRDLFLPGQSAQ
ncbi:putative RNA polymerase II subunit B1 CTD phosphatase RPAP2 homolog isoform X1 [Amborella trichopoda]|uniref:RNA polymerase II subunit B1 CTD phosphatase RPAP2 homolog n=1 Tax=Amborella trichopoda TaxID=13333 RepID=W1P5S2_AMBTC|nr:putative RNA polymerase II subunit B1 CTD phosphatase RPAP2 homolog isoform X1 [Amborella trichopoda]ERN03253.1 hypothetical protein AMTR_s00003p00194360 [Amborella trichopoda]|eukprot:XP_006841578.1 putative RNA polymerase II subunit B1 CTD phosphatase RPAP2 homolog isoform X1 [Amborella trichopoda]